MLEELKVLANSLDVAGAHSKADKIDLLLMSIAGESQKKIDGKIEVAIQKLSRHFPKEALASIADEITDLLMLHSDAQKFLNINKLHEKNNRYRVTKNNGLPITKYHNSLEKAVAYSIIKTAKN